MSFIPAIPPLFDHQKFSVDFMVENDRVYDASDPGTGKTRSSLETISRRQKAGAGKALILATKSILKSSWEADCKKFTPHLSTSVAFASNRTKAFAADANIYITNHDAVKWIDKNLDLGSFDIIVIDEITAFKHRTSQRSKALAKVVDNFKYRYGLSGTPNPNGVMDLWHQYYVLDDGQHLSSNYFKFRNTVCTPEQSGPGKEMVQWVDKPGSQEAVADILSDMTLRHVLEDCISIPKNTMRMINFDLDPSHLEAYNELKKEAVIQLNNTVVTAVHAGALATKLLQMASGTVYDANGNTALASSDRFNLVMDLAEEREQCVIAFNWTHQRDELVRLAQARKMTYAVFDGSTTDKARERIVKDFQNGQIKLLFAQPQSGSHGLTLTKGTTTIWTSPVYNAEYFLQFNRRIYRAGQTRKTETIMIAANDTLDSTVYDKLTGKVDKMTDLLAILETPTSQAA